jgi:hypothetical protein
MMRPLRRPPNWLKLRKVRGLRAAPAVACPASTSGSFGPKLPAALLKKVLAAKRELRLYSKTAPWNSFCPRGVASCTCEAPSPCSPPAFCVVTVNSATSSVESATCVEADALCRMKLSWMLRPSSVMLVADGRWPLIEVACAPLFEVPA